MQVFKVTPEHSSQRPDYTYQLVVPFYHASLDAEYTTCDKLSGSMTRHHSSLDFVLAEGFADVKRCVFLALARRTTGVPVMHVSGGERVVLPVVHLEGDLRPPS